MKRLTPLFIGAYLFASPSLVFGASFAKQSLFLSKNSVTEGDTVLIHAVVSNEAAAKFSGNLIFSDNGEVIGSVPVTLAAQEAETASISWKPTAGSHPVTAELKNGADVVEKQSATFKVAEKPKVAAANTSQIAAVQSSADIQESIASLSPGVADATEPFFTLVDGGRAQVADAIEGQIGTAKKNLGTDAGSVLGAEAVKNAPQDPMGTFWFILWTLYLYALTLLKFVIGNAGVFYPVFALLVLYMLWRVIRRFRRPAY